MVSAASQPDWYVMFLDGSTRLMPAWEIRIPIGDGYTIPPLFWPTVVLPGILIGPADALPVHRGPAHQGHAQRTTCCSAPGTSRPAPRWAPWRSRSTSCCSLSGGNDVIADKFHISLNAMTWAGRIGLLVLPPLAYYVTYRICLGLQQHDREVLAHGVETGIIRRLPDGRFVEVHQPLGAADDARPRRSWTTPAGSCRRR